MKENKFKGYIYGWTLNGELGNLTEIREWLLKALPVTKSRREGAFFEGKGFRLAMALDGNCALRVSWGETQMTNDVCYPTDVKRLTQKNIELIADIATELFAKIYKEFTKKTIE